MTKRRFEQILERCLQEVARTGDAEAVLQRYPRHADRLRPLLEVATATSRAYAEVPQPPGGLAAGRARMLDAAARQRGRAPATKTQTRRKERTPKMKLVLATKLIGAVLAAMVGVATVGGGVTMAAGASLPGDALYGVKLTGEDLRLALAANPEAQVELALQFSDVRIAEMESLVERGQDVPETVVARMERHVFRAMNQAARTSDEEMPGLLQRITQRTQVQAQTLEQLRTQAQEQTQTQLERAQRICQQAQGDAAAGQDDPQTFRRRYQHRDSMPDDVTPPEPPAREPGEGGQGPQGPGGPNQDDQDTPAGEGQGNGDQDRDRDRDQECEPPQDRDRDREDEPDQDRDRDREQDREDEPQQDQDRDRNQDPQDDPQQNQDRDRDQDQGGAPDQDQPRDQEQNQNQDPQQDQQQDPQQDQGGSGGDNSSGDPGSSDQDGKGSGKD